MAKKFYTDVIFYLYDLVYLNFNKIKVLNKIDANSELIVEFAQKINDRFNKKYEPFNLSEAEIINYLYFSLYHPQNKKQKVFPSCKGCRISNWKTTGVFLSDKCPNSSFFLSSVFGSKDLAAKIIKENYDQNIIDNILNIYNDSHSILQNISNISTNLNLYYTEVVFILTHYEKLKFDKNNLLKLNKSSHSKAIGDNMDNEEVLTKIQDIRLKTAELYNHYGEHNLILSNEGTGVGKSFSTINQFFDFEQLKKEKRVAIFSAPHKTQLKISSIIFDKANNIIPILYAKGNNELSSLDKIDFSSYDCANSIEQAYLDIFSTLTKQDSDKIISKIRADIAKKSKMAKSDLKTDDDDDEINLSQKDSKKVPISPIDLKKMFYSLAEKNKEIGNVKRKKEISQQEKEELEYFCEKFQNNVLSLIKAIIVAYDDEYLNEIINSPQNLSSINCFIYKFIKFAAPFEFAKYSSCLILMTTAKTGVGCFYSDQNKIDKTKKAIKNKRVDEIVSSCSQTYGEGVFNIMSRSDQDVSEFLKNDYFHIDKDDVFYRNDISFSLIFDEEHCVHPHKVDESYSRIFEERTNVVHALCGLARMYSQSLNLKNNRGNNNIVQNEKDRIIDILIETLKSHTVLNTDSKIKKFFLAIKDNNDGFYISREHYSFILSIFKNLITFNNKTIMSSNNLKSIRVSVNAFGGGVILLDRDINQVKEVNDKNDESTLIINMHDFIQIILFSLYVLRETSNSLKQEMFRNLDFSDNQDEPLYNLIVQAVKHRDFFESLLFSNNEITDETKINHIFAYFLPKMSFGLKTGQYKHLIKNDNTNIKAKIEITLINEQPEVHILRSLIRPKNKVFLLSATRGFDDCYSGCFNSNFFNVINDKYYNGDKISIGIRSPYNNPAEELTKLRFQYRESVNIASLFFKNGMVDVQDHIVKSIDKLDFNDSYDNGDLIHTSKTENYLFDKKDSIFNIKEFEQSLEFGINLNEILDEKHKYHAQEIVNIINSMAHCFYENKNGIILSLTNNSIRDFGVNNNPFAEKLGVAKNINEDGVFYEGENTLSEKNKYKVYSFTPMRPSKENEDNPNYKRRVKLVFFDADLGKDSNFDDVLKTDENTNLIIISSFNSAGTGLNLTPQKGKDFNSIYFASKPFWSNVKDKIFKYQSTYNLLLSFRRMAASGECSIGSISDIMSQPETMYQLEKEHDMELLKAIIQAVGRIERETCNIRSSIYFVDSDVSNSFDDSLIKYFTFYSNEKRINDGSLIKNMSFLNKSVIKTANYVIGKKSMGNFKFKLQKETKSMFHITEDFFKKDYMHAKIKYEHGNPNFEWFQEFNKIFRDMISPDYDIVSRLNAFLDKHETVLASPDCQLYEKIEQLKDNLIFHIPQEHIGKPIMVDFKNHCFSDITMSGNKYLYKQSKIYGYLEPEDYLETYKIKINKLLTKNKGATYSLPAEVEAIKTFHNKYLKQLDLNASNEKITSIPNLYLRDIIRGNIGEFVFKQFIEFLNEENMVSYPIEYNQIDKIDPVIAKRIYEVFDFYIIRNKKLLCIDVKNWSSNEDSQLLKTKERLKSKINKIEHAMERLKELGIANSFELIYLNVFPRTTFFNFDDEMISQDYFNYSAKYITLINKKPTFEYLPFVSADISPKEKYYFNEGALPLHDTLSTEIMEILK